MALTGEEIRANLTRFVARWNLRPGYERGEAQTFLTELVAQRKRLLRGQAGVGHHAE